MMPGVIAPACPALVRSLTAFVLVAAACLPAPVVHAGPAAPGDPFPGPRGEVMLPSGKVLRVELADTPQKRATGYMYREKVSDAEGMLFFFDEDDFHTFWMKNCKVGLDLVWLDEKWKVVHIERDVPPCKADPCATYLPMQTARYVLETQAGLTGREKLALGDTIIYVPPHDPPQPAGPHR
jgi:uncharacterized protein